MTFDYDVELDPKNHIVAHLGGKRCLIDTGCPYTLSEGEIEFGGAKFKGADPAELEMVEEKGWNLPNIRKLLGLDIDALVGTDVLSTNRFYVDPFEKKLVVGKLLRGRVENIEGKFQGTPVLPSKVNGDPTLMLLDTGANVNFISRRYSEEWPIVGIHEDFYPTLGTFKTSLRRATFKMFGFQFGSVKFADLPEELDILLQVSSQFGGPQMHGIAGMEVLNHGCLGFDLRNGVVVFTPPGESNG